MKKKNIRVAVIVPVYKVEKYLEKCVESICRQDYKNLEILLVDDGSPDSCPIICDKLEKKDTRIKVLHKKNEGLSEARNYGVIHCNSEYVVFVDSDDYVEKNYVSSLIELLVRNDAEVACTPLIFENINGKKKKIKAFDEKLINTTDAMKMVMRAQYGIGVTACSKLFPKDLLLRHPFPKGKLHEDIAVAFELFSDVSNVAISSVQTYHYIQHEESITHKKIDFRNLFWIISLLEHMIENNKDIELKNACVHRIYELVNEICRVASVNDERKEILQTQAIIRPYLKSCFLDPLNGPKRKLMCFMLAYNYLTFKMFCYIKNAS